MHSIETLWLFLLAFGASAFGGILGMASGIFIVPLLSVVLGIGLQEAIAASSVSVIACSCAGASTYLKAKLTNFRLAMVLEISTTLGALTGVILVGSLSSNLLSILFCLVLFISAFQMYANRKEVNLHHKEDNNSLATKLSLHSHYKNEQNEHIEYFVQNVPLGMSLMYLAGVLSALLGIGSGVLKIPAMDSALKLPIKVSSATSNFMIGVTAASSAAAYFLRGAMVPSIVGPVILGSVVGSVVGAKILVSYSSARLRIFFIGILVLLGIQMVYQTLRNF